LLNWRSSSIDMSFHPYPSEVKDLMYDFNYFKIIGILHINMWHVVKHFIILWHVTISFLRSLSWHLDLHCVCKINQYVQAFFIENQSNICMPHLCLWQNISMHHELFAMCCSRIDYMQCMCQHSTSTLMNTMKMSYKR
jgi:hypothetical protein